MELKNLEVKHIIFKNKENNYAVLACQNSEGKYTLTGNELGNITEGSSIDVEGEWKISAKHGKNFCVSSVIMKLPVTDYGILKYLQSGLIKGLGIKAAEKIVEKYGTDTFCILDIHPENLLEIKGITESKLEIIKQSWNEQKEIRKIMVFLKQHNVTNTIAKKIYDQYGLSCISILSKNPYQLADDIKGIGFVSADKIATDFGYKKDSVERIMAGLIYVLTQKCEKSGSVFIFRDELIKEANNLLGVTNEQLEEQVKNLEKSKNIIVRDNRFYPKIYFFAEKGVAHSLTAMSKGQRYADINFRNLEEDCNIIFEETQKEAIKTALKNRICVITGGPGTGKTTTTMGIIQELKNNGKKVLTVAPTGRAAKRMNETTGTDAKTIHRELEFSYDYGFQRNEDNQLEGDAIILDEASMVDILLMNNLLKAIPPTMQMTILGDVDQLPSIGCGNCLHDMIASEMIPVVKLTKIFRQSEGSEIINNAHRINNGLMPTLNCPPDSDFVFLQTKDAEETHNLLLDIYMQYLNAGGESKNIQVLSPQKEGLCGINRLNAEIQNNINPPDEDKPEIYNLGRIFREGDKIMQLKNNYDKDIFNGDIGFIKKINEKNKTLIIDFNGTTTEFKDSELADMTLAYAATIHKSQGSEFPVVLIPIITNHWSMLQRNLLYTAVTRAKKKCIIIGQEYAVKRCVTNNVLELRNSTLIEQMADYDF